MLQLEREPRGLGALEAEHQRDLEPPWPLEHLPERVEGRVVRGVDRVEHDARRTLREPVGLVDDLPQGALGAQRLAKHAAPELEDLVASLLDERLALPHEEVDPLREREQRTEGLAGHVAGDADDGGAELRGERDERRAEDGGRLPLEDSMLEGFHGPGSILGRAGTSRRPG